MTPPEPARLCPICRRQPLPAGQRFCSDRCRQVDLGRWLSGDYAVAAKDTPEAEDQDRTAAEPARQRTALGRRASAAG